MHILGEYRDDMVLVGGWIPDLLIPTSSTGTFHRAWPYWLDFCDLRQDNLKTMMLCCLPSLT